MILVGYCKFQVKYHLLSQPNKDHVKQSPEDENRLDL